MLKYLDLMVAIDSRSSMIIKLSNWIGLYTQQITIPDPTDIIYIILLVYSTHQKAAVLSVSPHNCRIIFQFITE